MMKPDLLDYQWQLMRDDGHFLELVDLALVVALLTYLAKREKHIADVRFNLQSIDGPIVYMWESEMESLGVVYVGDQVEPTGVWLNGRKLPEPEDEIRASDYITQCLDFLAQQCLRREIALTFPDNRS